MKICFHDLVFYLFVSMVFEQIFLYSLKPIKKLGVLKHEKGFWQENLNIVREEFAGKETQNLTICGQLSVNSSTFFFGIQNYNLSIKGKLHLRDILTL